MNPYVAAIVGALSPQQAVPMSTPANIIPQTPFPAAAKESYTSTIVNALQTAPAPEATPFPEVRTNRNVSITDTSIGGGTGGDDDKGDNKESGLTAFQVKKYASGSISLMKSVSSIYNGYIANSQYRMQARNKDFLASQNERAAELLKKNMRDINRAAEADANVYRLQGVKTKSAQRVAQAASGFAVGKGTYGVMFDTTDARTRFNASMIMLKAGLQNAEVLREVGGLKAQAIINRFDAHALREQGDMAISKGWADGIMHAVSAGADFYVGYQGLEE